MPTNQEAKQASVRAVTGTTYTYEGDWHALFDAQSIDAGTFNERLLSWINTKLGTSHDNIQDAKQAFADDVGVYNWDAIGTFDASMGDGSLADVIASAVFDLDATQSASYPGTGVTWANLVTAPADGSGQTDYDFFRGDGVTSTTYPTFSTNKWTFDGGDSFRIKSGANTSFINNLHKTTGGTDFWVAFVIESVDGTWVNSNTIFATYTGFANGLNGIGIRTLSSENLQLFQSGGAASAASATASAFGAVTGFYLVIMSHSASTNGFKIWVNSSTPTVDTTLAFDTSTTNPSGIMYIGQCNDAGEGLTSDTNMVNFAMGNEFLDDTKAAAIIAALETRHGRDYTP